MFVGLTHLRTGRPTYIDAFAVTAVRQNHQGETLVLTGDRGQYVVEPVALVVDTVTAIRLAHSGFPNASVGLESDLDEK